MSTTVMGAFLHSDGSIDLMGVDPSINGIMRLFDQFSFDVVYGENWAAIVRPYSAQDLYQNLYAQFVFDKLEPAHRPMLVWGSAVFVGVKPGMHHYIPLTEDSESPFADLPDLIRDQIIVIINEIMGGA